MTAPDPLHGADSHREVPKWVPLAVATVATIAAIAAAGAWLNLFVQQRPTQPLTVTACTPESWTPGARQVDCERWFAPRGDTWPADQPVRVLGEVCLAADEPVSYRVQVAWESVGLDSRLLVIDTPITYDPGCQDPYDFDFELPATLASVAIDEGTAGEWRVVGRATPVDESKHSVYQWDATATVEVVAPTSPPAE